MENLLDNADPVALVRELASDEDPVRKMAAFKLQSLVSDPSFADRVIQEGGLKELRNLMLQASGNTLAYTLASFYNILDLDQGWDYVDEPVVKRLVQLVVAQPLVNILRAAMSIIVAILSRPASENAKPDIPGFKALKPTINAYPQFLDMLVTRLSSADHSLSANSLQLINLLLRDAITNESDADWSKFVKQIQELGVIKAVYVLMQGTSLHDLAPPLLEFQALTKLLLKKWKEIPVDLENRDHRGALRALHFASTAESLEKDPESANKNATTFAWKRLGFETESPMFEFDNVGYLGMMDLTDFVQKSEDGFQKLLLEQSGKPADERCPIAKASLAMTSILYDHFEVEDSDENDRQRYAALDSRSNVDKAFQPLLLQWSRLHTAGLQAFLRLWALTAAEAGDFNEIEELVRILVEQVLGSIGRTTPIMEVEDELAEFELQRLRDLQMDLLDLTHEDAWGHHLRQVKDELHQEALQFIKEQRVRCLLDGAWFPSPSRARNGAPAAVQSLTRPAPGSSSWRFVRLSQNRRFLHYDDFGSKPSDDAPVAVEALENKIDLSIVSSVVSSVPSMREAAQGEGVDNALNTSTELTIHGYVSPNGPTLSPIKTTHDGARNESSLSNPEIRKTIKDGSSIADAKEAPLLSLYPQTHSLASEWLDGLLMLLNQQPITAETNKLVDFISKYGLRIRLLNVRFEEGLGGRTGQSAEGGDKGVYGVKDVELPGREGVDDDFYYEIGGA